MLRGRSSAVDSDGSPASLTTPELTSGWMSSSASPSAPMCGVTVSCVPTSRNLTLSRLLVSVVIFVISAEKVPGFDFVPAYFIGAGVFFGLMTHASDSRPEAISDYAWYLQIAKPILVACVIGLGLLGQRKREVQC